MSDSFYRLALIQMLVRPGELEGNLAHAEELIGEAAAGGASLVVLPECLDLGWCDPSCQERAELIPGGRACQALIRAARKHRVFVCAGFHERAGDNIHNAAVLIDPKGEILLHHRKINELDIATHLYACGDRLGVAHTELGVIGLMICADGFADGLVLTRSLARMGAGLILSPCAWAVPVDHDNEAEPYGDLWRDSYRPVAKEFGCAIIGVSNVGYIGGGPWKGRPCIGCSLVIDPGGVEILQAPYGADAEHLIYLEKKGSTLSPASS